MVKDGCMKWCILISCMLIMATTARSMKEEYDFTEGNDTTYKDFVEKLRGKVAESTGSFCGLKSTRSKPQGDKKYVLLTLTLNSTSQVTLGITADNLYVWGYRANNIARFLKLVPDDVKRELWNDRKISKSQTNFTSNYKQMEKRADITRNRLRFVLPKFRDAAKKVYGKEANELNKGNDEAKFFLYATQMVAEAVRFRFIMDLYLGENHEQSWSISKEEMVDFQNKWNTISKVLHAAQENNSCGHFSSPLKIGERNYTTQEEIQGKIGILLHKSTKISPDDVSPVDTTTCMINPVSCNSLVSSA